MNEPKMLLGSYAAGAGAPFSLAMGNQSRRCNGGT